VSSRRKARSKRRDKAPPAEALVYSTTCRRKIGYRSKAMAKGVARKRSRELGAKLVAYDCPHCPSWHIGHDDREHLRAVKASSSTYPVARWGEPWVAGDQDLIADTPTLEDAGLVSRDRAPIGQVLVISEDAPGTWRWYLLEDGTFEGLARSVATWPTAAEASAGYDELLLAPARETRRDFIFS
jgi:hypothetical protein